MQTAPWSHQERYAVRFEWGEAGVAALAGTPTMVVVDVLRFTTAVEAGVARGLSVFPCRWRDATAATFARSVGAALADGADPGGPSLSPASLVGLEPGGAVVLPSPNGSTCAVAASETGAVVAAACLRNAAAVSRWARARGGPVAVIAAGERWPDGSLRPAVEDLLGAGAVLARLDGDLSPEAQAAVAAFAAAADRVSTVLADSVSGRELAEKGCSDDVAYASELDVSRVVPVLGAGAFRAAGGGQPAFRGPYSR